MQCLLPLVSALAVAGTQPAPLSDWVGEWRLDRAHSRLRADVTRIRLGPDGYVFDLGAVSFTLPDDGRFHPTVAGRETRLARLGDGRWEREHRINGLIVDHSILTLSRDQRILLIEGEHPGAKPERLMREGRGRGLAGVWRSTNRGVNVGPVLLITQVGQNRVRWEAPDERNWYVVEVGGPPAVNQGPRSTPIATLQMLVDPNGSLRWIERLDHRTSQIGIVRATGRGDTLTETVWPAGSPAERQMLVYHRAGAEKG